MGVLLGLTNFRDGRDTYRSSIGVEHVVIVAGVLGKKTGKRSKKTAKEDRKEYTRFLWRFGWFLRCQARQARSLILDGLTIPYSLFSALLYLDYRVGLELIVRNVSVLKVPCEMHLLDCGEEIFGGVAPEETRHCGCLDCVSVIEYRNYFRGEEEWNEKLFISPNSCLMHHLLAEVSEQCKWMNDLHEECSCRTDIQRRIMPVVAKLDRIKGSIKIVVEVEKGSACRLEVNATGLIADLRELVHKKEGIDPFEYVVELDGKVLSRERTLQDCGVVDASVLTFSHNGRRYSSFADLLPMYVWLSDEKIVAFTFPTFRHRLDVWDIQGEIKAREGFWHSKQSLYYAEQQRMKLALSYGYVPRGALISLVKN